MQGSFDHPSQTVLSILLLTVFVLLPCSLLAAGPPESIVLNAEGEYFDSVVFDHQLHAEIGACFTCHHHSAGGGTEDPNCIECHGDSPAAASAACRDCHEASPYSASALQDMAEKRFRYHRDTPGLKGAMHRNCLGCHEDMDGPTGCQDCHARTARGEAFYAGTLGER